jgi:hypothetical protein
MRLAATALVGMQLAPREERAAPAEMVQTWMGALVPLWAEALSPALAVQSAYLRLDMAAAEVPVEADHLLVMQLVVAVSADRQTAQASIMQEL